MSRRFALTYENKILRKIMITVSIITLVFITTGCDSVQNDAKDVTEIPLNSKLDSLISESIIAWNQDKLNHTKKQFEIQLKSFEVQIKLFEVQIKPFEIQINTRFKYSHLQSNKSKSRPTI